MRVKIQPLFILLVSVTCGALCAVLLTQYHTYRLARKLGRWTGVLRSHTDDYQRWLDSKGLKMYHEGEVIDRTGASQSLVSEAAYLLNTTRIVCCILLDSDISVNKFTTSYYNVDGGYSMPPMTTPDHAIRETWAKKCSKVVFYSSHNAYFPPPTIKLKTSAGVRTWTALREASMHLVKTHLDDYDWFLVVEEDTFVILENLAYYLSVFNSSMPWYFGHSYTSWGYDYNVGGAGTVLSKGALRRLSNKLALGHCPKSASRGEQMLAECLSEVGIQPQDTRDELGRANFLAFRPESHLVPSSIPWSEDFWTHSKYLSGEVSFFVVLLESFCTVVGFLHCGVALWHPFHVVKGSKL